MSRNQSLIEGYCPYFDWEGEKTTILEIEKEVEDVVIASIEGKMASWLLSIFQGDTMGRYKTSAKKELKCDVVLFVMEMQ